MLALATTIQVVSTGDGSSGGEENGLQTILECTHDVKVKADARSNVPSALSVSGWCDEDLQRLGESAHAQGCALFTHRDTSRHDIDKGIILSVCEMKDA